MTAAKAALAADGRGPAESPLTPQQRTGRLVAAIGEITPERARRIVALLAAGAASGHEREQGRDAA